MADGAYLYIVRCSDGSFYTGTTRGSLEIRLAQHNSGELDGYTATRRPVMLAYSEYFSQITDAIANERKLKKWTRAKKEAYARGDFDTVRTLSKRRPRIQSSRATSFETAAPQPPQDEE